MRCHVQETVASCFAVLRQLRSIRRSVPTSVYQTLVVALVLSRLDYGNAVMVGLPGYMYSRLHAVGTQRCRTIHRRFAALGPHHRHTRQFPLVESARACAVQAGDDRLPLTERHSSIILGCRPATFVRHAVRQDDVVCGPH